MNANSSLIVKANLTSIATPRRSSNYFKVLSNPFTNLRVMQRLQDNRARQVAEKCAQYTRWKAVLKKHEANQDDGSGPAASGDAAVGAQLRENVVEHLCTSHQSFVEMNQMHQALTETAMERAKLARGVAHYVAAMQQGSELTLVELAEYDKVYAEFLELRAVMLRQCQGLEAATKNSDYWLLHKDELWDIFD